MNINIPDDLLKIPDILLKGLEAMGIFKKSKGRILSLDIGKCTLKIALLSFLKGKVELLKYDIKEIKPEKPQDEEKILVEFIRNFISANSIIEKDVIISLQNSDDLIIKRINLPGVPDKEIAEAVKWEIKDDIPFDVTQAQVDWQLIGEYTDKESAKRKDIISSCVKNDFMGQYVKALKSAGLDVIEVKSPPFNFSYILDKIEAHKNGIVSVLDIGAATSIFSVYKDGKLNFLRNLPFSSDQITASMTGVLVSNQTKIEITKEKAEEIKKEHGIPKDPNQMLIENIKGSHIISFIRPALERLVSEITKSINYYATSFGAEAAKLLYITGGGSNLKGLDAYLKDELKMEVDKLPLSKIISVDEKLDNAKLDNDMAQLASAIGAVLGIGKTPNLLPQEYRAEKVEAFEKISLRLAGIIIGLIFLFSFLIARIQVNDYKNRLKNAKLHFQAINEINDLNSKAEERTGLVNKIKGHKVPPHWILKELGNVMPATVLLKELMLDEEAKVLILKGYVVSRDERAQDELTIFMKNLELSPFFDEAMLRSSDKAEYEGRAALKFEIQCELIK